MFLENIEGLISIIVPIYKVEKVLPQCLDSLISQTYKKLEIICVNDGSPDASLEILEEYAKRDQRIKIITRPNGGLSAARNTGLKHARGQYIGFVDSDDWCNPDMFEVLKKLIESTESDFVNCGARLYDDKKAVFQEENYFSLGMLCNNLEGKKLAKEVLQDRIFEFNVTVWSKLFRQTFLEKHSLKFKEGYVHEDEFFYLDYIDHIESFAFTKQKLYNYRVNRGGSIMENHDTRWKFILELCNYQYQVMLQKDLLSRGENELKFWTYFFSIVDLFLTKISISERVMFYDTARIFFLDKLIEQKTIQKSYPLRISEVAMKSNSNYKKYILDLEMGLRDGKIGIFKRKIRGGYVFYSLFGLRFLKKDGLSNYHIRNFKLPFL